MIDVRNLDKLDTSRAGLEAWWLFCLTTGAASAERQARRFNAMLSGLPPADRPFEQLRLADAAGELEELVYSSGLGKYERLLRGYRESLDRLDGRLEDATPDELQKIHGVGMKTARLFLLYARENAPYAVLDVHVLRRLQQAFPDDGVPAASPSWPADYLRIEALALKLATREGLSPREFDQRVWRGAALQTRQDASLSNLLAELSDWCERATSERGRSAWLGDRVLERQAEIVRLRALYQASV